MIKIYNFNFYENTHINLFFQLPCSYAFLSYKLADCGTCLTTNISSQDDIDGSTSAFEPRLPITVKLKKLLKDVEIQTKYE